MCVCFERNFLVNGQFIWRISGVLYKRYMHGFSREEDEEFIRQYKKVLIVMSKDFLTDLNVTILYGCVKKS